MVGVDSLSPVKAGCIADATRALGISPRFWGRHFTNTDSRGTSEYQPHIENEELHHNEIRVLPIARQPSRVGGNRSDGQKDGASNARDLVSAFGEDYLMSQGGLVRLFLDVEGGAHSQLSKDYYQGWVESLAQAARDVTVMPCVSGIPEDAETWDALSRAVSEGTECDGLRLSRPCSTHVEPVQWDHQVLADFTGVTGVEVLLWQYNLGERFNRNLINPSLADTTGFLDTLVLPPHD